MEFLSKLLGDIFGSAGTAGANGVMQGATEGLLGSSGFMDMLGGDAFKNLTQGLTAGYGAMKAGDQMDFNQSMATKADGRQDVLMANLEEDREKDANRNFDFNYTA